MLYSFFVTLLLPLYCCLVAHTSINIVCIIVCQSYSTVNYNYTNYFSYMDNGMAHLHQLNYVNER